LQHNHNQPEPIRVQFLLEPREATTSRTASAARDVRTNRTLLLLTNGGLPLGVARGARIVWFHFGTNSTMACQGRGNLGCDSRRDMGEGSSWLAGNRATPTRRGQPSPGGGLCRAARGRAPNRLRLAGGDQGSDQRPSDYGKTMSTAGSYGGITVFRDEAEVESRRQQTSVAGEGIRFYRRT
jgi:hypothetical protein